MNDAILTSDDGLYRVVATEPFDLESPRWGAEFGSMFCVHPRYNLGDEKVGLLQQVDQMLAEEDYEDVIEFLREHAGTTVILPLYLHDHSGLSMTAGANLLTPTGRNLDGLSVRGWDTSLVGAIFDTAENRQDWVGDTEEILRREVAEYDCYLRGDVHILRVEQKVTEVRRSAFTYPDRVDVRDSVHTQWEPVYDAGVSTTYGDADHAAIAAEMLHEFVPATKVVEG